MLPDKEKTTTVKISEQLKKKLKIIAAENDSSIKDLVESAIREKYKI